MINKEKEKGEREYIYFMKYFIFELPLLALFSLVLLLPSSLQPNHK